MPDADKQIHVVEFFDERWYKIARKDQPDEYYPSVTTKLSVVGKPFLATWRGDIGNREADMRLFEAQNRGSRIHKAWHTLLTGGICLYQNWKNPNYTKEEVASYTEKFNGNISLLPYQDEHLDLLKLYKFLQVVKPKIIATELPVYSDKYEEAGTIDNVFGIEAGEYLINGKEPVKVESGIYVADLKTGKSFDDTAYLQMAAYANMYTELTGVPVKGTLGLHTGGKTRAGIEGLSSYLHTNEEMNKDFQDFRHVSEMWLRTNKNAKPRTFVFPALLTLKGDTK